LNAPADHHEAAVLSSAFDLLAVALKVTLSFTKEEEQRHITPSANGSALLAE
jgi:hypothetical protein